MAKYTIEDIEILRAKSGISYEEAVNLLEYHNGSLARALVDLEKNGRLKNEGSKPEKGFRGIIDFLFHLRVLIKKDKTVIINVSSLFVIVLLLFAAHICVIGLIASLLLGYRISVEKDSEAFADDHIDDMVKKAKNSVHSTVNHFAKQFADEKSESSARNDQAASGTRPVNVQFPDGGSVDVRDDGDGYHEADIH